VAPVTALLLIQPLTYHATVAGTVKKAPSKIRHARRASGTLNVLDLFKKL
jgi:hypothetical protein